MWFSCRLRLRLLLLLPSHKWKIVNKSNTTCFVISLFRLWLIFSLVYCTYVTAGKMQATTKNTGLDGTTPNLIPRQDNSEHESVSLYFIPFFRLEFLFFVFNLIVPICSGRTRCSRSGWHFILSFSEAKLQLPATF